MVALAAKWVYPAVDEGNKYEELESSRDKNEGTCTCTFISTSYTVYTVVHERRKCCIILAIKMKACAVRSGEGGGGPTM